jgi:hypothetical protein
MKLGTEDRPPNYRGGNWGLIPILLKNCGVVSSVGRPLE